MPSQPSFERIENKKFEHFTYNSLKINIGEFELGWINIQ